MSNTYKDRERAGRPRVPEWARPRPNQLHRKPKRQQRQQEDDYADQRERLFDELYDPGD